MRSLLARLRRLATMGVAPDDDERERLAKASATIVVVVVCLLSPAWVATYLFLGRPLSAAIPAAYVVFSVASLYWLARSKSGRAFYAPHVALILVLPFALQWSLGGFAHGSGVALWAFAAPLAGLMVWGHRRAVLLFAAFVAAVLASGVAEPWLRSMVGPLPQGVTNAFLVLNVIAPLTVAFLSVTYFMRQRDAASARSEELLLNVLPPRIASRLKGGESLVADRVEQASVLFVDIADFTPFAERTAPDEVVSLLGRIFSTLDGLSERHGLDKIKTLGDGYLAVAGLSDPASAHADSAARMALEIEPALRAALGEAWPGFQVRVGIASGPLLAGVIGTRRFSYDLWGDTVNTASRMTSSTEVGTVQISEETRHLLGAEWPVERREGVEIKGKGRLTTYRLLGMPAESGPPSGSPAR